MAWLHAVPTEEKKGALARVEAARADNAVSRLEAFRQDGRNIPLPENPAPYLTDWLFEIGPVVPGPMGAVRIDWRDIAGWAGLMGICPMPWEARLLRRLSGDYAAQLALAARPDCPAPWMSEVVENRNVVASKVAAIFGGRVMRS